MDVVQMIQVQDLHSEELRPYTELNEVQLKRFNEPDIGLFLAESWQVIIRALDAGYTPVSFLAEESLAGKIEEIMLHCTGIPAVSQPVPVYTAHRRKLTEITGYHLTGGLMCLMKRKPLPSVETILSGAGRIAVLERVTNPTNIGAIFRSAAALGMEGILLSADCCDPLYRRAVRVSLGTVFQIPWTVMPAMKADNSAAYWPQTGMDLLHLHGFQTVSMALTGKAVPISDSSLSGIRKQAVILGNECYGISDETLALSDHQAMIPMENGVDSLNVAAASAVAFWQLRFCPD